MLAPQRPEGLPRLPGPREIRPTWYKQGSEEVGR